jgi:hypothetical protein
MDQIIINIIIFQFNILFYLYLCLFCILYRGFAQFSLNIKKNNIINKTTYK